MEVYNLHFLNITINNTFFYNIYSKYDCISSTSFGFNL